MDRLPFGSARRQLHRDPVVSVAVQGVQHIVKARGISWRAFRHLYRTSARVRNHCAMSVGQGSPGFDQIQWRTRAVMAFVHPWRGMSFAGAALPSNEIFLREHAGTQNSYRRAFESYHRRFQANFRRATFQHGDRVPKGVAHMLRRRGRESSEFVGTRSSDRNAGCAD